MCRAACLPKAENRGSKIALVVRKMMTKKTKTSMELGVVTSARLVDGVSKAKAFREFKE